MTVAELNLRFAGASATNDLADAGVLVHQFDNTEADVTAQQSLNGRGSAGAAEPWMPCPAEAWCGKFGDRLSASLISPQMPHLFSRHAGYILSPSVQMSCSYFSDGGTMEKQCREGAPAGCVPGCCRIGSGQPNWCPEVDPTDSGSPLYDCAFPPSALKAMLRHKLLLGPPTYNEIVVSTARWQESMPNAIEAFFYLGVNDEQNKAHAVFQRFQKRYPHSRAILVRADGQFGENGRFGFRDTGAAFVHVA